MAVPKKQKSARLTRINRTNNILNNSYNKIINESANDLLENTNKNYENEDKSLEDKSLEDKSLENKSVEEESLEENNSDNNIIPIDLEVCLDKDGDSKEESERIRDLEASILVNLSKT
jgi:hypothetical protein